MADAAPRMIATVNPKQFRELMWRLSTVQDGARIAVFTAENKSAAQGRTFAAKAIAAQLTARIGGVNKRITVRKASRNRLSAAIDLHGKYGVSLIAFFARQTATGVRAKVKGQMQEVKSAFIEPALGGGKQVFQRQGAKRLMAAGRYKGKIRQPLVVLRGPTIPEIFDDTPGLAEDVTRRINEVFPKNLESQVQWLLERGQVKPESAAA